MSFELHDHTADIAVEAAAGSLGATFSSVADGLTNAQCVSVPDDGGERFPVTAQAESKEALLFEYLSELIYRRDVRGVLPADHAADVHWNGEWVLAGSSRAVGLGRVDAREVKAVTYSEMELEETPDGWRAYVVFDV